jgi:hypothetical protein
MAHPGDVLEGAGMKYSVVESLQLRALTSREEELEAHLDGALEALMDLGAADVDMGGSLASGAIEISMTVEAVSAPEAQALAARRIRRAIRSAGGFVADARKPRSGDRWPAFDLRPVGAEPVRA